MRTTMLAALAAAGLATAVAADPPPPGPDPAQAAADRADDMSLLLGLRPDQRPALDDFLGATIRPRDDAGRGGPPDPAAMQARMAALQRFRATLSPDQQARLDAIERLRHGMRPAMGGHRRWGGGEPPE